MTVLTDEGDGIIAKRIIYLARKMSAPRLVAESGHHRGLEEILHAAEAYIDIAVEK
jgi:pheromone shutdown protein TraB